MEKKVFIKICDKMLYFLNKENNTIDVKLKNNYKRKAKKIGKVIDYYFDKVIEEDKLERSI